MFRRTTGMSVIEIAGTFRIVADRSHDVIRHPVGKTKIFSVFGDGGGIIVGIGRD